MNPATTVFCPWNRPPLRGSVGITGAKFAPQRKDEGGKARAQKLPMECSSSIGENLPTQKLKRGNSTPFGLEFTVSIVNATYIYRVFASQLCVGRRGYESLKSALIYSRALMKWKLPVVVVIHTAPGGHMLGFDGGKQMRQTFPPQPLAYIPRRPSELAFLRALLVHINF